MKIKKILTPTGLALLLSFSLAAAALVNYISNTITYTANIQSPLFLHDISPVGGDFGTVYGGDTVTASYQTDNNANNPVDGIHEITIYGSGDLLSGDITEVVFTYNGISYSLSAAEVIELTGDFNGDGFQDLRYQAPIITHAALSANVPTSWDITFHPALSPGTYSFDVVVRPA